MEYWEVDLRSRKDGNTVETIFLGEWHDEACDCLNRWYKEHPEVDVEVNRESLVDGADGVFADIYCTETPHGVGKWNVDEIIADKIYRTVEQECECCGKHFYVRYCSDGTYEYIGEGCDCEDGFCSVEGEPSISQWLETLR